MPDFRYVARSTQGERVEGVVTCNDRSAAIRQVESQRLVPIKIEPIAAAPAAKPAPAKAPAAAPAAKSSSPQSQPARSAKPAAKGGETDGKEVQTVSVQTMSHSQQHLFTEQLAHLLGAGMTLDESLGILVRRMKQPKLHSLSKSLHQALVDGRSLSQAMRDFPRVFSPLYVNMVAAGEASGALTDILRRLVEYLSQVKALRDRVQQALLYPAILVLAGMGLVIIFITVMVPQLTGFFKQTGGELPAPTRILLDANALLVNYWWAFILAGFGLYTVWQAVTRTPAGRMAWDTFLWNAPLYGMVMRSRFNAQFSRTMGTLAENGVTLLRALELLEQISGNEFVRAKMVEVRRAVVDGANLSTAVAEQKLFPELFVDMMSVGEQTGRFGATMTNIADVYERELDKQVELISTLIPPMVMLVIASLVGFVVFGVLSAVFSLTQGLRGGVH